MTIFLYQNTMLRQNEYVRTRKLYIKKTSKPNVNQQNIPIAPIPTKPVNVQPNTTDIKNEINSKQKQNITYASVVSKIPINSSKIMCLRSISVPTEMPHMYKPSKENVEKEKPIENVKTDVNEISNMQFPSEWNIWIHKNSSNDWTLNGYNKIMTIKTIADLWNFINNFNKLNYMNYQFLIMRNQITPIWEDPENAHGGAATLIIRISDKNLLNIWEDICLLTINEQICTDMSDVNGISFNLKDDLTVIKVWNKNMDNDISKKIPKCLINKYKLYSISYRRNVKNRIKKLNY